MPVGETTLRASARITADRPPVARRGEEVSISTSSNSPSAKGRRRASAIRMSAPGHAAAGRPRRATRSGRRRAAVGRSTPRAASSASSQPPPQPTSRIAPSPASGLAAELEDRCEQLGSDRDVARVVRRPLALLARGCARSRRRSPRVAYAAAAARRRLVEGLVDRRRSPAPAATAPSAGRAAGSRSGSRSPR